MLRGVYVQSIDQNVRVQDAWINRHRRKCRAGEEFPSLRDQQTTQRRGSSMWTRILPTRQWWKR